MQHQYTAGKFLRKSLRFWISVLLVWTMGFTTLAGCDSRPKATTQTTVNAQSKEAVQSTANAQTSEASEATPNAEPLVFSPYYSIYEFELEDKNVCRYLLADEFCSALTASYSDEYLAALARSGNDVSQSTVCDESGNPLYPDFAIHSYSYTGESLSTIDLSAVAPSSDTPLLAMTGDNIAVLCRNSDTASGDALGSITVFNRKGEMESRIEKIPFDQPLAFINDFCADGNGNYYIRGEDADFGTSISVVSADGKLLAKYPMTDTYPEMLIPSSDGIYMITRTYDNDGSCTTTAIPISDGSASLDEGIALPSFFNDCGTLFMEGDSIYGSDLTSLQVFSLKTKTLEPVLEWKNLDLTFMPNNLSINGNGAIVAMGTEFGTDICNASVLTPSATDPNAGKTEIVVAGFGISTDPTFLTAVKCFNQSHSDSRIVLRDYAEDFVSDSEDYRKDLIELNQKMRLELYSGDAPDIWIDRESDSLGLAAFAGDAYLIDLYPYFEKDPDINPDDYFRNVLFGYDTNGKLYMFPSGFFTRCFYGNPSVIGTDSSWTFSDYYALSEKLGPEEKILTDIPKTDLLEWTLETQMGSYLDLNSGRVSFDSANFIELLKWADTYGADVDTYEIAPADVMKNRLAIDLTWIESPGSFYSNYSYLKFMPTYLGYPNTNDDGLSFCPEYVCGITTSCENPDLAWDFVRLFLLDDVQDSIGVGFIPVSKDAAAKQIENTVSTLQNDGFDVSAVDDNFWNSYYDVLEQVSVPSGSNYAVTCIVFEESAAFFAGQKTAEEVAELIQNRVQIYVDEQMN